MHLVELLSAAGLFSSPNQRSSTPLTPHEAWFSTATVACFPARPLHVCLQIEHSLLTARFPLVRPNVSSSSASSCTPCRAIDRACHLTRLPPAPPQAVQTP